LNTLTQEDERQIHALLLRYATAIDTRDWPLLKSCFTASVKADYGDFGSWHSADEIATVMRELHKDMGLTLHRISNIVITSRQGLVTARSYVDAMLTGKTPQEGCQQGIGFYDDEFVKSEQGWKIQQRKFTLVQML